jgi:hypothetical protein
MVDVPFYPNEEPAAQGVAPTIEGARRVIFHILTEGFELLREDEATVDRIFRRYSFEEREAIKTNLRDAPPSVIHGYARKGSKAPLISIVTNDDKTEQSYLGDFMGIEEPDYFGQDPRGSEKVLVSGSRVQTGLEIWIFTEHPDVLFYHYALTWVLLHASRIVLETLGLTPGEMAGGDVAPDPRFMPDFIYVRRITFPISGDRAYAIDDQFINEILVRANIGVTLTA